MQPPKSKKKIGMSRRELEWALQGLMRQLPTEPQALARHLAEVMVTLIEQNNAALARSLMAARDGDQPGDS